MSTIIGATYKIIQDDRNPTIYTIFLPFSFKNEQLITSITKTKILLGATISDNYKTLTFKATTVNTFKMYQSKLRDKNKTTAMKYNTTLKLVENLATQLDYLIRHYNKTFLGYHPENIIVVDGNKFVYLSSELFDIDINNAITITYPFSKTDFLLSPELESISEIPSTVHFKTSYYSLGCLIIYALLGDKTYELFINVDNEPMNPRIHLTRSLDFLHIKGTQLYWLIKRCLDEEPNKRTIIFI